MGLLSDPKTREKIVGILKNHGNKMCILCYVVGLVWFLALAYKPLNAGTYFSENALLPGLVEPDFYNEHGASNFLKEIRDEMRRLTELDTKEKHVSHKIPSAWFEDKFRSIGLDAYVQNYSFWYPVGILKDQSQTEHDELEIELQKFYGQNVYGVLRAPRAGSTEAVVLSVPYRPPEAEGERTTGGMALMLALAKAFKKHTYWAKDIIFLLTEHEEIGMQAWLSAYHDSPTQYIKAGELESRSGSIQAAINLELPGDSVHRFNIKLEGLNGQLPNLDLVNTVSRLCRREGIPPTLHKRANPSNSESYEGFQQNLRTMLAMMWDQAPGFPTGNHGLFHRYHIEAISLQGYRLKTSSKMAAGFSEMGRVVEGIFRSLNNLLERFHQSFFFYLLPATDRYVSIGLYMPPFGLLALPVVIKQALGLWITASINEEAFNKKKRDAKESGKRKQKEEEISSESGEEKQETMSGESYPGLLSLIPVMVMVGFFAILAHNGPRYFIQTGSPFHMPPGESLLWGALALQLTASFFPRILKRKAQKKGDTTGVNPTLLKCMALFFFGTVLGALSVMNISLAFFLAVVWVPVVLIIRPSEKRYVNFVQYLLLQLISPLFLLFVVSSLPYLHLFQTKTDIVDILNKIFKSAQGSVLSAVIDSHMYGNWLHTLVTGAVFPNWLMFWALLWTNHELY